ncbi:MAG: hypothetical protein GC136_08160 [Alphaproteobacteria bacterium]|nr:hypothetical protein [Alphaproteobacteria bacterium]
MLRLAKANKQDLPLVHHWRAKDKVGNGPYTHPLEKEFVDEAGFFKKLKLPQGLYIEGEIDEATGEIGDPASAWRYWLIQPHLQKAYWCVTKRTLDDETREVTRLAHIRDTLGAGYSSYQAVENALRKIGGYEDDIYFVVDKIKPKNRGGNKEDILSMTLFDLETKQPLQEIARGKDAEDLIEKAFAYVCALSKERDGKPVSKAELRPVI